MPKSAPTEFDEELDESLIEDAESVPSDSNELEARLREKEQLVGLLTERLERAAEQLDRVRRNGSDRGRVVAGGVPPELIASQQRVLEDIELAVERFEAANTAETLGRIEAQIGEIRSLVVCSGGAGTGEAIRDSSPGESSETSAWDAMKERILTDSPPDSASSGGPEHGNSTDGHDVQTEPDQATESPVAPPEPRDPPEELDVESADRDELAVAVLERDEYIAYLLARLRQRETRPVRVDWEALADAPDELRERLEELETRLEETLRRAEIEQSLERAKLGRIATELDARAEWLEKQLAENGLDEASMADRHEADAEKGPRWMRMLGLGKGD